MDFQQPLRMVIIYVHHHLLDINYNHQPINEYFFALIYPKENYTLFNTFDNYTKVKSILKNEYFFALIYSKENHMP